MEIKYVVRHTLPTKYDLEPFGTICTCYGDNEQTFLYLQASKTEEPDWVPFHEAFSRIFARELNDVEFHKIIISLLDDNNEDTMLRFITYLQEPSL